MLLRRHPRRWVKHSSIIVQSKKKYIYFSGISFFLLYRKRTEPRHHCIVPNRTVNFVTCYTPNFYAYFILHISFLCTLTPCSPAKNPISVNLYSEVNELHRKAWTNQKPLCVCFMVHYKSQTSLFIAMFDNDSLVRYYHMHKHRHNRAGALPL